jgi:hypothetical protein
METEKSAPAQRVIRAKSMMPWGWPTDAKSSFTHVLIPDGTPCTLVSGKGGGLEGVSIVRFDKNGRAVTVEIENQYLRTS